MSDGILKTIGVDLSRYKEQLDYEIFPMYIQLINQTPQQVMVFPKWNSQSLVRTSKLCCAMVYFRHYRRTWLSFGALAYSKKEKA